MGVRLLGQFRLRRFRKGRRIEPPSPILKLLDIAQQRWRRLDGAVLLPLVRAGVKFVDGVQKQARNATPTSEAAPREAA